MEFHQNAFYTYINIVFCRLLLKECRASAKKAGVKKDDLIRSINGNRVKTITDLKLLLMDESPGDEVTLLLFRKNILIKDKELELVFPLGN